MNAFADKQTLDDLNILGRYKPDSMFSLFNKVHTRGGEKLLHHMFLHPMGKAADINRRCLIIEYFHVAGHAFPFQPGVLEEAVSYIGVRGGGNQITAMAGLCKLRVSGVILNDTRYKILEKGLRAAISILKKLHAFVSQPEMEGSAYREEAAAVLGIFSNSPLSRILKVDETSLNFLSQVQYDNILRNICYGDVEKLIDFIFRIDVYITVANVAKANHFSYAVALPKDQNFLKLTGLRHPALMKGVGNSIAYDSAGNAIFLTGANMAGKSTLMKSFGLAVYLAHIGFPVAAEEMTFSVREGIYSSINVPDNLNLGYSHFYAEVLRVKQVAIAVAEGKYLVVLFDELFKGTNVKDAYEATLAVAEGFVKYRNCFFIISTHIIEVGKVLREKCDNLRLNYLPTVMDGKIPQYTYQLKDGITTDRHGMMIIENEGILGMINECPPSAGLRINVL